MELRNYSMLGYCSFETLFNRTSIFQLFLYSFFIFNSYSISTYLINFSSVILSFSHSTTIFFISIQHSFCVTCSSFLSHFFANSILNYFFDFIIIDVKMKTKSSEKRFLGIFKKVTHSFLFLKTEFLFSRRRHLPRRLLLLFKKRWIRTGLSICFSFFSRLVTSFELSFMTYNAFCQHNLNCFSLD